MEQRKVYFGTDKSMLQHRCEWDAYHLEHPGRLSAVLEKLENSGILRRCILLKPKVADKDDLSLVHSQVYIERIAETQKMSLDQLEKVASTFDDVYFNNYSYIAAATSVGLSLEALKAVLSETEGEQEATAVLDSTVLNNVRSRRNSSSFVAIRPPGHHASREKACGFCIFNNVAICAKKARTLGIDKVLIVDWDVHAGQGTQYAIADDPKIKLISIHRYEYGLFWPHLSESAISHSYENTINVPLNAVGMGDSEYIAFMQHFVIPIIYDFMPGLILVSCGFDAAFGDEEGNMNVSPAGYYWMTKLLDSAATAVGSRLCMLMEGGYFIDSLACGVQFCMEALLGDAGPNIQLGLCNRIFLHSLHSAILFHAPEFPNLQMLSRVTRCMRIRCFLAEITPFRTEYKYQKTDERCDVYPTRGLYSRPSESVIQHLRQKLKEILLCYRSTATEKEEISLVFTDEAIEGDNNRKELQMKVEDLQLKAVINFMQLHILNTPCTELVLSKKNRMEQQKFVQKDYISDEGTTVTIVENLLKLFRHGHCLDFQHLLNFELDLT
uniref:Histone deacetylase domain-containing protein n=1 Tax=Setaria digitata TaxID=48799 RepID=A0A915Q6H9_9BILA